MPTQFGTYTLIEEISRGATSIVYRAQDKQGKVVVIKTLARHLLNDATARQRFLVEVRKQPRGANIVQVLDSGVCGNVPYIAMEFIDGTSLMEKIRQAAAGGGALSLAEADSILRDIGKALDAAHAQGIIHRDVKPGNILIRKSDQHAFLTDFGLAHSLVSASPAGTPSTMISGGSTDYIAPEQINGGFVGPATDIYSLGITVYHALSGELPFKAENSIVQMLLHVNELPPMLSDIRPLIPQAVSHVVMRALEKGPQLRYQSATEFAQQFHLALTGAIPVSSRRPVLLATGGAAVLIVVVFVAALAMAPSGTTDALPVVQRTSTPLHRAATLRPAPTTELEATDEPLATAVVDLPMATATLAPDAISTSDAIATSWAQDGRAAQAVKILPISLGAERWGRPTSPDGCRDFEDKTAVTKYEIMLTISNTRSIPVTGWRIDSYGSRRQPLVECMLIGAIGTTIAADASYQVKYAVYLEGDVLERVEFVNSDTKSALCVNGKSLVACG